MDQSDFKNKISEKRSPLMVDEEWESVKIQQRNMLREQRSREREKLDRILFVLASGTLSLTSVFVGRSSEEFMNTFHLRLSWIFFIASIISIIIGYVFSQKHFSHLESVVKRDEAKSISEYEEAERNFWAKCANATNAISFMFVTIGLILLVLFAWGNV